MPQGREDAATAPRTVEDLSFEEALAELEAIVKPLERARATLEDAVARLRARRRAAQALRAQLARGRGRRSRPSSRARRAPRLRDVSE